jgi:hypothetical protein
MRKSFKAAALTAAIAASGLLITTNCRSAAHTDQPMSAVAVAGPAPANPAAAKVDIPVTVVKLFSSGVGYFQHSGTIDGDATAELNFDSKQINDVLKSLVLEDEGGGRVSVVSYASEDPLQKKLKSFQVDITGNPSLDELLNQLRGAKVTVDLPTEQASGVILGVEKRVKPAADSRTIEVPVLNLLLAGAVREIELPDIRQIRLDDPQLQSELDQALSAVAESRDQDKKPVTVHFQGQGKRDVLLGYVVETPVWKTSYRLVLGDAKTNDAHLQGWAIVENQTDQDWNNVQLSLVSGRPISFVEDLYQPLYVQRPVVQNQEFASIAPPVYSDGLAAQTGAVGGAMQEAAAPATLASQYHGGEITDKSVMDITRSMISQASAAKIGELFQYTIDDVSLPRQSSAMIPIISDPISAERVSIYNAAVMSRNPLNGARLHNTTGKHVKGGPLTVFDDGSYAGDAQIDDLPPGQDRLVSFGIDLQMLVDTNPGDRMDETLTAKISAGVLEVTHQLTATTVYSAQNKSDADKTLIIEHPFQPGWKLVDTPAPVETTPDLDRFQIPVAAGKTAELTVKEREVQDQEFTILDDDADAIISYTQNGAIPQPVKDALEKAADFKRQIANAQRTLDADKGKEQDIVSDQQRIDDNIRTIQQNTPLYSRLIEKLNSQESDLEKLRGQMDDLNTSITSTQKQLEDYLRGLNVG